MGQFSLLSSLLTGPLIDCPLISLTPPQELQGSLVLLFPAFKIISIFS